jgi:hypothetical protein
MGGTGERGGLVRRGQRFEHLPTTDDKVVFGDPVTWTMTVERQEGVVFSGTWASENRTDPMVGAISANGRSLYLARRQRPHARRASRPDQMEICRSYADAERMLAGC